MSDSAQKGDWLQVRGWSRMQDNAPVEIRKSTGGVGWEWVVATEQEKQQMLAAPKMAAEIERLTAEVELWKDRWAAEWADHEASLKHCDKMLNERT